MKARTASGSREAHEMAVFRMIRAGADPMTWLAMVSEWQRDWARTQYLETLSPVLTEHSGGTGRRAGLGVSPALRALRGRRLRIGTASHDHGNHPAHVLTDGRTENGACLGLLKRRARGTSQFALHAVHAASRRKMPSSWGTCLH